MSQSAGRESLLSNQVGVGRAYIYMQHQSQNRLSCRPCDPFWNYFRIAGRLSIASAFTAVCMNHIYYLLDSPPQSVCTYTTVYQHRRVSCISLHQFHCRHHIHCPLPPSLSASNSTVCHHKPHCLLTLSLVLPSLQHLHSLSPPTSLSACTIFTA